MHSGRMPKIRTEENPNRLGDPTHRSNAGAPTSIAIDHLQWLCHVRLEKAVNIRGAGFERREESSPMSQVPHSLRKLPAGPLLVHDGWTVARSDGKGGKGGSAGSKGGAVGASSSEREALERAFADVKPLGENTEKACKPPAENPRASASELERPRGGCRTAPSRARGQRNRPREAWIHTRAFSTRSKTRGLEIEAECDLHGRTAREAEREVHRFVRDCQRTAIAGS